MIPRLAIIAGLLVAAAPLTAREPLPKILACAVTANANWVAASFASAPGDTAIHLDTVSGEWHLANARAAALTVDSGDFEIVWDGTDHPAYWLGLDDRGATQMRIDFHQPGLPFLFVGHDNALFAGRCVEPGEPFIFLR